MKQEVIRELSTQDLNERLVEERNQLAKLSINHAVSPIENPQKIKAQRRTVARILTEMRKRQLESAKANEIK